MGFNSVDEYVNQLEESAKTAVNAFIEFMKTENSELSPKITYSMPMWWFGRKIYDGYIAISAATKHYSIHFPEDRYITELKEELPNSTYGKRCINIKYGDEAALAVVKQKVKECIKNYR